MCAFCLLKQGCEPLRWPSFSLKAVLHQCAGLLLHILFAASKAARRTEYLKAAAKDVQKVIALSLDSGCTHQLITKENHVKIKDTLIDFAAKS